MSLPAKKERELTENQQKFLAAIPECNGNLLEAKKLAGYADTTALSEVVKSLKDEIIEVCEIMLAENAPSAVANLVNVMFNPEDLGAKTKMDAAKEILNRVGVKDKEAPAVTVNNPIFILPAKKAPQIDFDDVIDAEVIEE